jgi:outer membrane assembly lipoprotein YfiO
MRWLVSISLMLGALVAGAQQPATRPGGGVWELRPGGAWQPADPAVAVASDEMLDQVEQMLQSRQPSAAHKLCLAWIRAHKDHALRDRAVYLLGMANFASGNRIEAFYNFDEVLDLYPNSRYFYPALEQQYVIADEFLKGYKLKFLGLPLIEATGEATEILYRIQQRAPGSPLAEKALLRVADYYYADSQFDLAADAYAAYIRSYPRSPWLPRVRLRQAFASLAQFRGTKFDATPVIDARQQLLDIARLYPDVADQENVAAIISRIDASLAIKLLETADYYRRTGQAGSAAYYYRYLILQYPEMPEAAEARERLARLPAAAREAPVPPVTRPATLPVEARP